MAQVVAAAPDMTHGAARPRDWVWFHVGFAVVAGTGLLVPIGPLGIRVLLLTAAYSVGIVVLARRTGDPVLWTFWATVAPLSVLMILPDWFLSAVLGTLTFPDTGAPYVGTMPLFMALMWTVALLPVMLLGWWVERERGLTAALVVTVVAGLALFTVAEFAAPLVPLWHPVDVTTVAGIAPYVLLPEAGLVLATFLLVRGAGTRPRIATAAGIVAVPFLYLGMLCTSYQFMP